MTANVLADNAYEILGLPRGADTPLIRQAFRKLALKHHPDAVPPDQKEEAGLLFARINQAHELLRDPEKRRRYDALLERGITPDLSQEVGDLGGFASLADILGQIESLQIDVDEDRLVRKMSKEFRDDLLLPSLIRSADVHEHILDAVRLTGLQTKNYELPPGKKVLDAYSAQGLRLVPETGTCKGGWVVVTDIRIIVLMKFIHNYELRDTGTALSLDAGSKVEARYWRGYAFPYLSLKRILVRERGRGFKSYALHLHDEDDTAFTIWLKRPQLTRLFLVANVYRLPLTVQEEGSRWAEYGRALALSLVMTFFLFVSCVCAPLWVVGVCFGHYLNRIPEIAAPPAEGGPWFDTLIILLPAFLWALLLAALSLRVYLAWLGRPADVFGELAEDYAVGVGGDAGSPRTSPVAPERASKPQDVGAPIPTPAAPDLPRDTPEEGVAGPPLSVDVPDAVRDARGRQGEGNNV
jgi:hypothetical protein